MADDSSLDQNEIERLLSQTKPDAAPAVQDQPAAAEAAPAQPTQAPQAPPAPSDDDDKLLGQEDIEKLLSEAGKSPAVSAPQQPAPKQTTSDGPAVEGAMAQGDIEYLLNQAEQALESIGTSAAGDLPQGVASFRLEEFAGAAASTENATLDLICDVELDLKIELGRTHMYLENVLKLRKGSVVPLDKLAGDPVDIYVNGRLIARGEVLVLNDNFCVRVAELIAGGKVFA